MMYRNTYLDKIGELLQKAMEVANDIEQAVKELTDEEKIKEMFRNDVEFIMDKFYGGDITDEEALNNLNILKVYAISQLSTHFKRIVEVLDDLEKKIGNLKKEVSKQEIMADIVEDIVNTINRAEMELK
jgi:arsenate reductase-like glutaredoxin family protein